MTISQSLNTQVMIIKLYQFYDKMDNDNYRSIVKNYNSTMDEKRKKVIN